VSFNESGINAYIVLTEERKYYFIDETNASKNTFRPTGVRSKHYKNKRGVRKIQRNYFTRSDFNNVRSKNWIIHTFKNITIISLSFNFKQGVRSWCRPSRPCVYRRGDDPVFTDRSLSPELASTRFRNFKSISSRIRILKWLPFINTWFAVSPEENEKQERAMTFSTKE